MMVDLTPPLSKKGSSSSDQSASVYEMIREDIVQGRLAPNASLKASQLAANYGTSNNPVREALQQLRGEGFVVIAPNRGARVRPLDTDFVRNIVEIETLLEPYLTRWVVEVATDEDIAELEKLKDEIEGLNFTDSAEYTSLDTRFHQVFYNRHYNRDAVELWHKHREILSVLSRDILIARWRRDAILREHRELIARVKAHDAQGAAELVADHVRGSGVHLTEQLRARHLRAHRRTASQLPE